MSILVLIEHENQTVSPASLSTLAAAKALQTLGGGDITAVVAGENVTAVAELVASIECVHEVLCADAAALANALPENVAPLLVTLASSYDYLLANATTQGKDIMPRVAALLDVMQLSEIISVKSLDTFERLIYAGNAISTIKSADPKKVITVRATKFEPVEIAGGNATIETVSVPADSGLSEFVGSELSHADGQVELSTADIVVSGGRGLGSAENFAQLLTPLADKIGAALGASRAAVDSDFCPNDYQVGQTGKVVAPALYIAVGISGAIQHLAGMKDSQVIVAINNDPDAPIFQVADYGLVADLNTAVQALTEAL